MRRKQFLSNQKSMEFAIIFLNPSNTLKRKLIFLKFFKKFMIMLDFVRTKFECILKQR